MSSLPVDVVEAAVACSLLASGCYLVWRPIHAWFDRDFQHWRERWH